VKAAVLTAPGRVSVVDDWPEPTCGPGDVIVAVRGVGICGSDLSVVDGHRAVPRLPWALGHEAIGEIVSVGAAVTDRTVGQRIVVEPNYPCFTCAYCVSGHTSACTRRRIVGISEPGLLVDRAAVPSAFAWPAPDALADEDLVCVEPYAVALAAVRRMDLPPGRRCLVLGAGSQGLLTCLALQRLGAVPVVSDPHDGRVALAVRLGAEVADAVESFAAVVETSGAPAALETAVRRAVTGATIVLVGLSTEPSAISSFDLVQRQLTLHGSLIYDHPGGFRATIEALRDQAVRPGRVLVSTFPLTAAGEAFAAARGSAGKSWITLNDGTRA
jgi:threonine dehydrogenase-like Zn-dependent dehydrogenase